MTSSVKLSVGPSAAHPGGVGGDSTSGVPRPFSGSGGPGARPAPLPAGPRLPRVRGVRGRRAEEAARGVKENLGKGQAEVRQRVLLIVKRDKLLQTPPQKKSGFNFSFFIQKENIGLTYMFDCGYILWSLSSHLNAGPFPLQHTWGGTPYWKRSHAATAVNVAMPASIPQY